MSDEVRIFWEKFSKGFLLGAAFADDGIYRRLTSGSEAAGKVLDMYFQDKIAYLKDDIAIVGHVMSVAGSCADPACKASLDAVVRIAARRIERTAGALSCVERIVSTMGSTLTKEEADALLAAKREGDGLLERYRKSYGPHVR